jgi:hypothetical protein
LFLLGRGVQNYLGGVGKLFGGYKTRPDFGGNAGGGGKLFRGGAAILAHGSHGMLGLRMYPCPHKLN